MFNAPISPATFLEPWFELSESTQRDAWQQSQQLHSDHPWHTYINRLCLTVVLPWLQENWDAAAKPLPSRTALPSIWEWVAGTAIALSNQRLILLPSDAIDTTELRVPQEWIDIPTWAGDYYLAVQVNPEDSWLRIWGYATHAQLKQHGNYSARDRSYALAAAHLISDVKVLPITQQLCPDTPTRAKIPPLPALELTQATQLIDRLSQPDIAFPRREIPFALWGALLSHGGWRQRLYERRLGLPEQWSPLNWLQTGLTSMAEQVGWQALAGPLAGPENFSLRGEARDTPTIFSRLVFIADQQYELRVAAVSDQHWCFSLENVSVPGYLSDRLTLRLLTEDLHPFPGNEVVAQADTVRLELVVELAPGEGLVWELDPAPVDYEREILKF
jgi:Protein of unknown function (DUF1822)